MNLVNTENTYGVDQKKLNLMTHKILHLEKKNAKTREFTRGQMINMIRDIIETEVQKNI